MTPEFLPLPDGFDPGALLDSLGPALGLEVAPEHRPGTLAQLEATARMARSVTDFPLPDTLEPAPVFKP